MKYPIQIMNQKCPTEAYVVRIWDMNAINNYFDIMINVKDINDPNIMRDFQDLVHKYGQICDPARSPTHNEVSYYFRQTNIQGHVRNMLQDVWVDVVDWMDLFKVNPGQNKAGTNMGINLGTNIVKIDNKSNKCDHKDAKFVRTALICKCGWIGGI